MRLAQHSYHRIAALRGPLLLLEQVVAARMGEVVRIRCADGRTLEGEVLRIESDTVLVQLFGDSRGLGRENAEVILTDSIKQAPLADDLFDRTFDGSFRPLDGLPPVIPAQWRPISGRPLNPVARARPREFIETGLSAIDGLNTLVRGQKLPIFSSAGLPSKEIAAAILRHARLGGDAGEEGREGFVMVFVALGLTFHDYAFYRAVLEDIPTPFVAFINLADDPVVERLLAPRFGLTVAEHLAYDRGHDVLVLVADLTNYCDALREVSTAREELPGRRGYPGYMYSDLASLYERAGRIRDQQGSVTLLPVVTMPEEDMTHPIPDLTGFITEGQIVLSRDLQRRGVFPPIDVLPSLSRLMQRGIGEGRTRADHRALANALYRHYARGRDLRNLEAIVGRSGMTAADQRLLDFADTFETDLIHQGDERRDIARTLDLGRELLGRFELEIRT